MPQHRFNFTIRTLMITVVALGVLFAMLRDWRDFLPVFVLVVVPLAGLYGLRSRVPPDRPSWRFGVSAVMLGLIILGAGWLWARTLIWCATARGLRGDRQRDPRGRLPILGIDAPEKCHRHLLACVHRVISHCLHTTARAEVSCS